jgi:hypothetical protein
MWVDKIRSGRFGGIISVVCCDSVLETLGKHLEAACCMDGIIDWLEDGGGNGCRRLTLLDKQEHKASFS